MTTAAEGSDKGTPKASTPKASTPTTTEAPTPAPVVEAPKPDAKVAETVTMTYRGSSGRLVDPQSGSEFIRDGDPVTVDAEVAARLQALPFETFSIETQE